MRTMYDSVDATAMPVGAPLYAGYVDGRYANLPQVRGLFPSARIVSIAVSADTNAQVLDVENGNATPDQAPGWAVRQRARGVEPTVYMNADTWPAVRAAFDAAGVAEPNWFVADYDGVATIPAGAVAKQYLNTSGWDRSVAADYWPGVDPTPEDDMALTAADITLMLATRIPEAKLANGYIPTIADCLNGSKTADTQLTSLIAQVGALSAVVTALAKDGGLTAAQATAAAEAGADAALAKLGQDLTAAAPAAGATAGASA